MVADALQRPGTIAKRRHWRRTKLNRDLSPCLSPDAPELTRILFRSLNGFSLPRLVPPLSPPSRRFSRSLPYSFDVPASLCPDPTLSRRRDGRVSSFSKFSSISRPRLLARFRCGARGITFDGDGSIVGFSVVVNECGGDCEVKRRDDLRNGAICTE